jgi:choice-of-anchor A domain-containing protein
VCCSVARHQRQNHASGGIQLTGTDPTSNVFHVGIADLNVAPAIFISVPAGATALIVAGGGTQATMRRMSLDLGTAQPEEVLWAFCDAPRVELERQVLLSTLVAPDAELRLRQHDLATSPAPQSTAVDRHFIGAAAGAQPGIGGAPAVTSLRSTRRRE